jgi:transposase-like protein
MTSKTTNKFSPEKALERENRELRQANEILRKASAYLRSRGEQASRFNYAIGRWFRRSRARSRPLAARQE